MHQYQRWLKHPEYIIGDLLKLAERVAGGREGYQYTVKQQAARRKAAERARWLAERRRVNARIAARPRGVDCRRAYGERVRDKMLQAMEPGRWYGRLDISRAAGLDRNHRNKVGTDMLAHGLVERRKNSECRVIPGRGDEEPHWLYRLTELGELERRVLALL